MQKIGKFIDQRKPPATDTKQTKKIFGKRYPMYKIFQIFSNVLLKLLLVEVSCGWIFCQSHVQFKLDFNLVRLYRVSQKKIRLGFCLISWQLSIGFLNRFFLLKTEIHAQRTCSDLTQPWRAFLPFSTKKRIFTYVSNILVVICP